MDDSPIPDVDLTPVTVHGDILMKRDDQFVLHGVNGSKVMQALAILDSTQRGGIVGYGGRRSNTAAAMAAAARERGAACHFWAPSGAMTPELQKAIDLGATVNQVKPGYLSNCRAQAAKYADFHGLPCGLVYDSAIDAVAAQVRSLLDTPPTRIVVASGGYVLLSGIVLGLRAYELPIPVLSVSVGGSHPPMAHYLGKRVNDPLVEHVSPDLPYEEAAQETQYDGVRLDPFYEAKCIPFLEPGDLLWNSGIRTWSPE